MSAKRLPQIGFGVLVLATIGAFFLIQAVKTSPPLLWPPLRSIPAAFNPLGRRVCTSAKGTPINYAETRLRLAVQRAGSVGVYIVNANDASGPPKYTITSGTPMKASPGYPQDSKVFTWDGSLDNGSVATPGTYYFRIVLNEQDQSINLSDWPIHVITTAPHPRVVSVRVIGLGGGSGTNTTTTGTSTGGTGTASTATTTSTSDTGTDTTTTTTPSGPAVLTPPRGAVKIDFTRGHYRRVWIDIYRTDVSGKPQRVARRAVSRRNLRLNRNWYFWNGKLHGQPAPAGTYLVGITAQDQACNQASWPVVLPPAPNTTPGAGVTIRYLTVTPPLTPTVSGSRANVAVDSPSAGFTWTLRNAGASKEVGHGSGTAGNTVIHVRMPRHHSGLYTLTVRAGKQIATVPLVASQAGPAAAHARVLVVMPMLTWMGNSPVDDTGDGLPDTLSNGDAVSLNRPLVNGSPAGFASYATLLRYLDSEHLPYQLTTDIGLAEGRGPTLVNRWGVMFPGGEEFLPESLKQTLSGFVKDGGRVAALGTGVFRGWSNITGFPKDTRASAPVLSRVDPFGAQRGAIIPTNGELITELTDELGVFNGALAFSGFSHYQAIQPPSGAEISAAGIATGSPSIIAFRDGSGTVVAVGLPNFSASVGNDVDSQELLNNIWHVLAKER